MSFDINQDLSSLQNNRKPRNRRIRPEKTKASATLAENKQRLQGEVVVQEVPAENQAQAGQHVKDWQSLDPQQTEQISLNLPEAQPRGLVVGPSVSEEHLATQPEILPNEAGHKQTSTVSAPNNHANHLARIATPSECVPSGDRMAAPTIDQADPVSQVNTKAHPALSPGTAPLHHLKRSSGPHSKGVRRHSVPRSEAAMGRGSSRAQDKSKRTRNQARSKRNEPDSLISDNDSMAIVEVVPSQASTATGAVGVSTKLMNKYIEMKKSLLLTSKASKKKRQKIDPSAPIDPKSMTLMDVIHHAQCNANKAEQQYKAQAAKEAPKDGTLEAPAVVTRAPAEPITEQNPLAPKLVLRDGKIVVDESSLTVQARMAPTQKFIEVADDSDQLINSHSYLPLSKLTKERWTKEETELFYQILSSYGADFTFMAQCFQGRTRKQVKNKYLKEQKINPHRVHEAMSGRDVQTLKQLSSFARPETAQPNVSGLLAACAEGKPFKNSASATEGDDGEDFYEGEAVDPTLNDFFY